MDKSQNHIFPILCQSIIMAERIKFNNSFLIFTYIYTRVNQVTESLLLQQQQKE